MNTFKVFLVTLLAFLFILLPGNFIDGQSLVYLDSTQPIDKRIEDLLSRMTLEEKLGQLNMPWPTVGDDIESRIEGYRKLAEGTFYPDIGPFGGFFCVARLRNIHFDGEKGPREQAKFINELQKIAVEKTRLKIPLFIYEEGVFGLMAPGSTIFPEGLGIGSSWNMDLVGRIYSVVARESRSRGVHGLCTIVIEPNRDPRLGRNVEGYSECPYLCSQIAKTIVKSMQGEYLSDLSGNDKTIVILSHFPGNSQSVYGLERGAIEISERTLRSVFLPPWSAGITDAGALGVMAAYPAINGEAAHGSEKLLTNILREELGFQGVVFEDLGGVGTIGIEKQSSSSVESGILAIKAGVDVSISLNTAYLDVMRGNVLEGKVSMNTIDRAVRRVLNMKFVLGLFENPYVDVEKAVKESLTSESRQVALQAAREGIVLLKNENNLLPLDKKIKSIAVIGPNADNKRNQLGDFTHYPIMQDVVSVFEGIKSKVTQQTKITYVEGCNVIGEELNEIDKAVRAAKRADVAVVVVGESTGTTGEANDVASLDLTGLQEELIKSVHATGTPTIVVLINGRPLSIVWTAENVPVILEAWLCGEAGGAAIADILFGDFNPEGRLPISFPRHSGQLPVYYNYMPSKAYTLNHTKKRGYVDMNATPLFEFGFGLSYTSFEYSNLQITPQEINSAGEVYVSADVKNTGQRAGKEVVQLYINDEVSSLSTPVKELRGFEKISLTPGEVKTVKFKLGPEHLTLIDRNFKSVVEPGVFEVMIGSSSEDIRLKGKFTVK